MTVEYALVTGCSEGGIGDALCHEFQSRGLHVFVTARKISKISEKLRELPNVTIIALDVTKPDSIAEARAAVEKFTGGRLDYLVNNSGVHYVAPLLDTDIQLGRDMFEVNVWGVVAMVQSFAPLLLARKGTVVNIGSICGIVTTPWMSVYNGSKAAIGILSETLRLELAPFGVRVITCITGAVDTHIMANSSRPGLPNSSIFKPSAKEISERATGQEQVSRSEPRDFARRLVKDCMSGSSGKVFRGKFSSFSGFMSSYLPKLVMDSAMKGNSGLEKLPGPAKG